MVSLSYDITLPRQTRGLEGVVTAAFGEDVFQEQGAAGLNGGEAVFVTDAVNSFV